MNRCFDGSRRGGGAIDCFFDGNEENFAAPVALSAPFFFLPFANSLLASSFHFLLLLFQLTSYLFLRSFCSVNNTYKINKTGTPSSTRLGARSSPSLSGTEARIRRTILPRPRRRRGGGAAARRRRRPPASSTPTEGPSPPPLLLASASLRLPLETTSSTVTTVATTSAKATTRSSADRSSLSKSTSETSSPRQSSAPCGARRR